MPTILATVINAFILILLLLLMASALVHVYFLVPYVPTRKRVAKKMIEVAGLKPGEHVVDLGCGDGRLLLYAERAAHVRGVGFELAPLVYFLARIRKLITHAKYTLHFQNLFKADLHDADVIFCYLIPEIMPRLVEKILKECKKGTRVISNTFKIPGLTVSRVIARDDAAHLPTIYVYRI